MAENSRRVPDCVIILAAGKGSRMHFDSCPKVCFRINGTPAINLALKHYTECGIPQPVVVVGNLAEKVMATVSGEFPQAVYAFQKEQCGTANAIRCALAALPLLPDDANLLLVAGDRIIAPEVLEELFELHRSGDAALSFLATPCDSSSSQGRIVTDGNGTPCAIVEMADVRRSALYAALQEKIGRGESIPQEALRRMIREIFFSGREPNPGKAVKAFKELWELASLPLTLTPERLKQAIPPEYGFHFGDLTLTAEEVRTLPLGNTSVYLIRKKILQQALANLTTDNAQQEEYLSDLVHCVREMFPAGVIRMLPVHDKTALLGFNDPAELLNVERLLREKEVHSLQPPDPQLFRPLAEWQKLFGGSPEEPGLKNLLTSLYGEHPEIWKRQLEMLRALLVCAARRFTPATRLLLVRAPGRLNVMGRHVDHQGGNCNLMTISFETLCLASPRDDDRITLTHCDEKRFGSREFRIGQLLADLPWGDWDQLIASPQLQKMIREYGVDWSNYIQAAVLRLQKQFPHDPLRGMDMVIGGNIPMAAGLSSSSSLLIGAAEATIAVNHLAVRPSRLIDLCGQGEWFVGTKGGSADHAAVKLGRCGSVVKVKFFDFGIEETVPFPEGYSMIVCDSGIKACKSSNAKNQFNHRISCYRIGLQLIKKFHPQFSGAIEYLRDLSTAHLHAPLSQIYRILLSLPEEISRRELTELLPASDVETLCSGHASTPETRYPVRGVVLFGLAEMQRSARYADLLKHGEMERIGKLMNISHNGDRVVQYDEQWRSSPYHSPCGNAYFLERLSDLESGDVDRVISAQLMYQPGSYACSTPEIDRLADIAIRTPGVLGAQLAGAGLGGSMMILARDEAIAGLRKNLMQLYFEPAGLPESILICAPITGAGVVRLE